MGARLTIPLATSLLSQFAVDETSPAENMDQK